LPHRQKLLRLFTDKPGSCRTVGTQGNGIFADGLVAYQGEWMGGDVFVSFDKRAVSLLSHHSKHAR
jgi:hypothetical protein